MRTITDIPKEHLERLDQLCRESKISRAELLRRLVADYLGKADRAGDADAFGIWRDHPRDALATEDALRDEWQP